MSFASSAPTSAASFASPVVVACSVVPPAATAPNRVRSPSSSMLASAPDRAVAEAGGEGALRAGALEARSVLQRVGELRRRVVLGAHHHARPRPGRAPARRPRDRAGPRCGRGARGRSAGRPGSSSASRSPATSRASSPSTVPSTIAPRACGSAAARKARSRSSRTPTIAPSGSAASDAAPRATRALRGSKRRPTAASVRPSGRTGASASSGGERQADAAGRERLQQRVRAGLGGDRPEHDLDVRPLGGEVGEDGARLTSGEGTVAVAQHDACHERCCIRRRRLAGALRRAGRPPRRTRRARSGRTRRSPGRWGGAGRGAR